jgi:hypothetical protein
MLELGGICNSTLFILGIWNSILPKFNSFRVVAIIPDFIFPPVLPGAIEKFDGFAVTGSNKIQYCRMSKDPERG